MAKLPDGWVFMPRMTGAANYVLETRELVKCKNCKHYEVTDVWVEFQKTPILGASDQPTCRMWGEGDCKTDPDGWCFLGEAKDE